MDGVRLDENYLKTRSEALALVQLEAMLAEGSDTYSVWMDSLPKYAVKVGYWSVVRLLLQHDINPTEALDYAVSTDIVDVFGVLIEVTCSLEETLAKHDLSAGFYLDRAALYGSARVAELLLRHVGIPDDLSPYTLLADAAFSGNVALFRRLLDAVVAKTGTPAADILLLTDGSDATTSILSVAIAESASDVVAFLCGLLSVEHIAAVATGRRGVANPDDSTCDLLAVVAGRDTSYPAMAAAALATVRSVIAHLCPADTLKLLRYNSHEPLLNAAAALNAPLVRELLATLARLDPDCVPATALRVLVAFMHGVNTLAAGAPRGSAAGAACTAVADALLGAAVPGATLAGACADATTLPTDFCRRLSAGFRAYSSSTTEDEASGASGGGADADDDAACDARTLLEALPICAAGPAQGIELLVALVVTFAPQTRLSLLSLWTAAIAAVAGRPVRDVAPTPVPEKNPRLVPALSAAAAASAGSLAKRPLCPICLSARFDCAPVCAGLRAADDAADATLVDRLCGAAAGNAPAELALRLAEDDCVLTVLLPVHKPLTLATVFRAGLSVVSSNLPLKQIFSLPDDLSDRVPEAAARIVAAWTETEKTYAGAMSDSPADDGCLPGAAPPPALLVSEFQGDADALHTCAYTATQASAANILRWLLRTRTLRRLCCDPGTLVRWLCPRAHLSPCDTRETLDLVLALLELDSGALMCARLLGSGQRTSSVLDFACTTACTVVDSWPFLEAVLAAGAPLTVGRSSTILHTLLSLNKPLFTSNNDFALPLRRLLHAFSCSEALRDDLI